MAEVPPSSGWVEVVAVAVVAEDFTPQGRGGARLTCGCETQNAAEEPVELVVSVEALAPTVVAVALAIMDGDHQKEDAASDGDLILIVELFY